VRRSASSLPRGGLAVCVLLCAAIALADISHGLGKTQYVGLLAAVPFLAATFAAPRGVLGVGLLAWLTGAFIGAVHEDGTGTPQWIRLACIALATGMAAVAARSRLLREARLVAVQSAADAASRAILRPLPPVMMGVPVSVDYLSAFEAARVGGDLYDAVETPWGLRLVIGDVRGKGLEAVRLAAVTLGSFREAAHREVDLRLVAGAMHAAVSRDADPEDFVTALLVEIEESSVRMLSCGHPPPIVVRGGSSGELPLPEQPPLGIAEPGDAVVVPVHAGDRVLLYTDGAAEARRGGRFFGLRRAAELALSDGDLPGALARLSREVHDYSGTGPSDDVAFLAFELPNRGALVPTPG
jgi:phosphoserine phosphatase RsbU/P